MLLVVVGLLGMQRGEAGRVRLRRRRAVVVGRALRVARPGRTQTGRTGLVTLGLLSAETTATLAALDLEALLATQVTPVLEHVARVRVQRPERAFAGLVGRARHLDEAVVEAETVSNAVLPSLLVLSIVWKQVHDELIDLGQGQHFRRRILNGHRDQRNVTVRRLRVRVRASVRLVGPSALQQGRRGVERGRAGRRRRMRVQVGVGRSAQAAVDLGCGRHGRRADRGLGRERGRLGRELVMQMRVQARVQLHGRLLAVGRLELVAAGLRRLLAVRRVAVLVVLLMALMVLVMVRLQRAGVHGEAGHTTVFSHESLTHLTK